MGRLAASDNDWRFTHALCWGPRVEIPKQVRKVRGWWSSVGEDESFGR